MNCMKKVHGFTMIEMLLTLGCIGLCVVLLTSMLHLISRMNHEHFVSEDALAIRQIQMILAQASDIAIDGCTLWFTYHGERFSIEQYDKQLVKRKGFEVLMQGLDEIAFYRTGACVGMEYRRDQQVKKAVLACE